MTNRLLRSLALAAALCFGPVANSAFACPFCGEANAVDDNRSAAFELSILFMLGMPVTLAGAFGYGFYRLYKKSLAVAANATNVGAGEHATAESAGSAPYGAASTAL